jgi:excisionase family DNA binding protein
MSAPKSATVRTSAPSGSVLSHAGNEDICTVADVARWLKVDRKTVYDAVNRRELPSARLGRRVILSRAAITAWLAGGHQ